MDNIQALSEEDIKYRFITPSIEKQGWKKEGLLYEKTDSVLKKRAALDRENDFRIHNNMLSLI